MEKHKNGNAKVDVEFRCSAMWDGYYKNIQSDERVICV